MIFFNLTKPLTNHLFYYIMLYCQNLTFTPHLVSYITLLYCRNITSTPHLVYYITILYCRNIASTPHLVWFISVPYLVCYIVVLNLTSTLHLVYYITVLYCKNLTSTPHLVYYISVLYCRNLTSTPHLAGTAADLRQAEQLKAFWEEQGMTSVTITPFTVLLSYPDQDQPNRVKVGGSWFTSLSPHGNIMTGRNS